MKLYRLFACALTAVALSLTASAADSTPLEDQMEKLSKALKLVKRNLADASAKDANLAKIADAKAALGEAKKLEPAMTKTIPAGQKEKFLTDFKASIEETGKALDELKAAIEAGKSEEAAKVMEKLDLQKKESHKKFKEE